MTISLSRTTQAANFRTDAQRAQAPGTHAPSLQALDLAADHAAIDHAAQGSHVRAGVRNAALLPGTGIRRDTFTRQLDALRSDARPPDGPAPAALRRSASSGSLLAVRGGAAQGSERLTRQAKAKKLVDQMQRQNMDGAYLEFTDLQGKQYAYYYDIGQIKSALVDGITFDGSSIPGFSTIEQSDLKLLPDLDTFAALPWTMNDPKKSRAGRVICDPCNADGTPFANSPRVLLKEITASIPFEFNVAPEIEFFLTDRQQELARGSRFGNGGYAKHGAQDITQDCKIEILKTMREMGLRPEKTHGEVAFNPDQRSGQHEITMKYGSALETADRLVTVKNIIEVIADKHGFDVDFRAKPFQNMNGSGGHVNYSLFDPESQTNLFYSASDPHRLSDAARSFLAGNLEHAPALTAINNPTDNSYERLVKGFEAPVYICWGPKNRSAQVRIPRIDAGDEKAQRFELRSSDLTSNPYLVYAMLLKTGIDGIQKLKVPPPAQTEDLFELTPAEVEARGIASLPGSLPEALAALEADADVGRMMGQGMRRTYVELERQKEVGRSGAAASEPQSVR